MRNSIRRSFDETLTRYIAQIHTEHIQLDTWNTINK
jgi:hypothetical protein